MALLCRGMINEICGWEAPKIVHPPTEHAGSLMSVDAARWEHDALGFGVLPLHVNLLLDPESMNARASGKNGGFDPHVNFTWQRCRVNLMANALADVSNDYPWLLIPRIRTRFAQFD